MSAKFDTPEERELRTKVADQQQRLASHYGKKGFKDKEAKILQEIVNNYPETKAARQIREALKSKDALTGPEAGGPEGRGAKLAAPGTP